MVDPVTLAAGIGGLVRLAASVGQSLFNLGDGISLATREFEVFSQEVNTFATVWMVVQPCLTDPSVALSGPLLRTIARIVGDTGTILEDLRQTVDLFSNEDDRKYKVTRNKFLRITTTPENERKRRLQKFLRRSKITLQRSQISYATTNLNVMLAVIQHSKPRPSQRDPPLQADNEVFLVAEQRKARRRVEFLERDNTESPIMATEWLEPLPQAPSGLASPFDILAREWTRPTRQPPRAWQHENEDIRTYLNRFQQRIAQLEGQLAKDQHMIAELQASCRERDQQHEQDRHAFRRMSAYIETLEQDCQRLRAERNKQRQTIAGLNRDNEELDDKIYDLEQKCHSLEKGLGKVTGERDRYREERNTNRQERDTFRKELDDLLARLPPSSYPAPARRSRRSSRSSHTSTTYVASSRGSSSEGRSNQKSTSIRFRWI
ncbi:hypothetical protein H2202_003817 [Exophiala xenobiotica]|nr:hypothetical protein H2202_003817 [Exophiala xenobiotica]KAK5196996.1 hypothetical protein LTR92_002934 [Exophiala xenobiotica]KAK5231043.1 hypothetical protein LTR72_000223 [Exophiala xenobiotica]KAK5238021.1 hypothetical protein LTR47_001114 [Exophiala xenobiotica]KAK5254944.1 hypothetical protein LTS06_000728 [Exophiala xenobiotica]